MMRCWAYTTDLRCYPGHFFCRSPYTEGLEPAELGYLEIGPLNISSTIQENFEDSKDLVVDLLNEETDMQIDDSVLNEAFDLIDVAIDTFLLKDLGYTPTP